MREAFVALNDLVVARSPSEDMKSCAQPTEWSSNTSTTLGRP